MYFVYSRFVRGGRTGSKLGEEQRAGVKAFDIRQYNLLAEHIGFRANTHFGEGAVNLSGQTLSTGNLCFLKVT